MKGGVYKMFNDVPSLIGYLFISLLIYRYSKNVIGRLFIWVATFSYEWYLVHMLVISTCIYFLQDTSLGIYPIMLIGFVCSILAALLYKKVLQYIK
ncbi:hypothetical protein SAMN05216436_11347 [bacterium A37T11]|nr:hypothetical protein SAMN05216436_11347 [bacterium A37T11]